MKVGDPCPRCGQPLIKRDNMFYWRGRYSPGLTCGNHPQLCREIVSIRSKCDPTILSHMFGTPVWPLEGEEIPPLDPENQRNEW